jgi:hypothetical protein
VFVTDGIAILVFDKLPVRSDLSLDGVQQQRSIALYD